jgi:hypothetical protein
VEEPAFELSRPPGPERLLEPPAILEPRLRGMPPAPGGEIGDWEPVASEERPLAATADLTTAARDAALADDRVRGLLGGERTTVLGASQLLDEKGDEREDGDTTPTTVLIAYDYDRARAIEIRLRGQCDAMRVEEVTESDHQPSPSDEEIERAIRLARERAGAHLDDGWTANALLASGVGVGDRYHGQRRLVVVFGPADERLPRVRALVDLARDEVVGVDVRDELEEDPP